MENTALFFTREKVKKPSGSYKVTKRKLSREPNEKLRYYWTVAWKSIICTRAEHESIIFLCI